MLRNRLLLKAYTVRRFVAILLWGQTRQTDKGGIIESIETLVLSQGHQVQVIGVGDCIAPRTAEVAVFEGLKAGWLI